MMKYRFRQIRYYMAFVFGDHNKKMQGDKWWQIAEGIDGFNENRKRVVLADILKLLDELMSAFKPQTTKTGDLPHLTHIKRKPEPLGIEMKLAADTATCIIIFLEIQKLRKDGRCRVY